jgi:hypothetical protein
MSVRAAVSWGVLVLSLACARQGSTTRKVAVQDHGSFEIALPSAWRYTTEKTPEGGADTLRLEPPTGSAFLLMATPAWVPESLRDARTAATWMRVRIFNQTVEVEIPIEEFKGSRNVVYWFASTNKNPGPGEHEAMVQGAAMVGELLVGFTLLHHPGDLPERDAVLKALGDARQAAASP